MGHFAYAGGRLFFAALMLAAFMFGCARQDRVDAPDFNPSDDPSYQYQTPRKKISNESLLRERKKSMTAKERKVFERTGQLDKKLDPWMEQEVARIFLKYSRESRTTMQVFLRNSTPYLARAKEVFRRRGLPEDLAYLAFLESGYNPLAVSRSRAVGMWQFISSTGKNYGLRQDWWMDERMDPQKSTEAAAAYLDRLYDIFHDWHLAIASYNAGEGKIGRAKDAASARRLEEIIRKNNQLSYDLRLREETRLYVPRFLAIAKVVRGAEELGLKPAAHDEKHPALMPTVTLSVKPSTDLVELSRRMGMTWREFLAYNPQFLRSISPTNRAVSVHIPRNRESQARRLLAGTLSGSGWTYYTVRRRDTAARISKVTGVPSSIISEVNPGSLYAGRRIKLPSRAGSVQPFRPYDPSRETQVASADDDDDNESVTAALLELEHDILQTRRARHERQQAAPAAPARGASRQAPRLPATHKVRPGEYVTGIASKYGITANELYAANGGREKLKNLQAGQVIRLPQGGAEPAAQPKAAALPSTHKVQPGESLTGIARKYDVPLDQLYAANGGRDRLKNLQAGQVLRIPQGGEAAPAPRVQPARPSAQPKAAALPSTHKVQPGESLTGIARKYDVSLDQLYAANGGRDRLKNLQAGQVLRIPQGGEEDPAPRIQPARPAAQPKAAAMPATHKVQPGEYVIGIASKYGITPNELYAANGGRDKLNNLYPGQVIRLPQGGSSAAQPQPARQVSQPKVQPVQAAPASRPSAQPTVQPAAPAKSAAGGMPTAKAQVASGTGVHVVKPGETLWSIARAYGMQPGELLKMNGMDINTKVVAGSKIKVKRHN